MHHTLAVHNLFLPDIRIVALALCYLCSAYDLAPLPIINISLRPKHKQRSIQHLKMASAVPASSFRPQDALGPVRPGHELPIVSLQTYLTKALPSLFSPPPTAPITVQQYAHGQSNPTFLISWGPHRLVLRKKPPGAILASAHAVEREYAVLTALGSTGSVPVPRTLFLCEDARVIGTPFFLMAEAQGKIFLDPNLPELGPAARQAVYQAMARTLAGLHSVDPSAVGLAAFGGSAASSNSSSGGYCRRQLKRWKSQYDGSVSSSVGGRGPMPEVVALVDWLEAHIPSEDDALAASGTSSSSSSHVSGSSSSSGMRMHGQSICHGDYRLDNLVVQLEESSSSSSSGSSSSGRNAVRARVDAVLDWELSTLGV